MARRGARILETWEIHRLIGLWVVVGLGLFLCILASLPVGVVLPLVLIAMSHIWRPIGVTTNALKGEYVHNTLPFKLASFFMAYKQKYRESLFSPIISLGMGPPREDKTHNIMPGWIPMTRLSSYWCLLAALVLGLIDYFTAAFRWPFWSNWSDIRIPDLVMYIVGVIGFYAAIQSIVDVIRIRADKTGIIGTEAAPAVILSRVKYHVDLRKVILKGLVIGSLPVVAMLIIWATTQMPMVWALSLIAAFFIVSFLISLSYDITRQWRAEWIEKNQKRAHWESTFSFLKDRSPIYVSDQSFPTFEEYQIETEGMEEPPPYNPSINVATFLFPQGCTFEEYLGVPDKIRGAIGAHSVAVVPIGNFNPETGQEELGSIGSTGFRVWWSEDPVTIQDIIDPSTNKWVREFGVRAIVLPTIAGLRGLGHQTLISNNMMTRANSSANILEIKFVPPPNVNLSSFLNSLNSIKESLGVEWVGFNQEDKSFRSTVVTMMLGDEPVKNGIRFVNPARMARRLIDISNWSYYFHVNGVSGVSGTPRLLRRRPTTDVVDQFLFELPKGTPYDLVQGQIERVAETSGNDFIEASRGDDSQKRVVAKTKRDIENEGSDQARFTIIAAQRDPLLRAFPWDEYRDKVLIGRTPGVAKLDWSPGVLANDELVYDKWDGDLPHLLIAGASGMGKSNIAMCMLMQLAYNNSPDELELHFIEPKNELQTFENVDTCAELVDSWKPDKDFMFNAAESAEAMVEEMDRRYEAMNNHPKRPKKLSKAREIAQREGPNPDGSKHPLDMPYKIYYFEECATLFADAGSKEEAAEQKRLMAAVAELARKSRAAGIHLVFATQYPTNASIPSVIRNQCRRIGLGAQNRVASDVIIGQNGLEKISTPGLGMIKPKNDYRKFRGFWVKDGDPDHNEQNDIFDALDKIPQKTGASISMPGGGKPQRVILPDPSEAIFSMWQNSSSASNLDDAIDSMRKTKDIKEDDVDSKYAYSR